jgi:hypothetical protein
MDFVALPGGASVFITGILLSFVAGCVFAWLLFRVRSSREGANLRVEFETERTRLRLNGSCRIRARMVQAVDGRCCDLNRSCPIVARTVQASEFAAAVVKFAPHAARATPPEWHWHREQTHTTYARPPGAAHACP